MNKGHLGYTDTLKPVNGKCPLVPLDVRAFKTFF